MMGLAFKHFWDSASSVDALALADVRRNVDQVYKRLVHDKLLTSLQELCQMVMTTQQHNSTTAQ